MFFPLILFKLIYLLKKYYYNSYKDSINREYASPCFIYIIFNLMYACIYVCRSVHILYCIFLHPISLCRYTIYLVFLLKFLLSIYISISISISMFSIYALLLLLKVFYLIMYFVLRHLFLKPYLLLKFFISIK